MFLEISQNSQENTCARVSFLIKLQAWGFIKKKTLAQAFSCEFCEISKNTFFHRTPLVAAFETTQVKLCFSLLLLGFFCLFLLEYVFTHSISLMLQGNHNFLRCSEKSNFKQKISTRVVPEKTKSLWKEYFDLNFDQWEIFSDNYKSIRVFVYKINENNCRLQYFPEFIQTQNRYPTTLRTYS